MAANPFTRGTCPGRARPPHRGSFQRDDERHGGPKKGVRTAISPRARKAIAAAANRIGRGTSLNRHHWQRVMAKNPLMIEALGHQGQFTLGGDPRSRSRPFTMKSFGQDLGAVAMRAIKTDQFVHRDLVECLTLLAMRDPSEFAKFLPLRLPKQSYLAARPSAEFEYPWEAVNPGEYRRPPIPEWTLGFDPTRNSWIPVPLDPALTPQDAYDEDCGSPLNRKPGWDWKFDSEERRYRAIALRSKTPIPEWMPRFDKLGAMTPVPVDPRLTPEQAYHGEFGSPISPAPGYKWELNSTTQRLLPAISDQPSRYCEKRLYRWHPDQGHYSLVRDDDDDEDNLDLYEYDPDWLVFKPVIIVYEHDAMKDQFVRVAKWIK